MRVKALTLGFYGKRMREGEVFLLKDKKNFSKKWMVEVGSKEDKADQLEKKTGVKAPEGDKKPESGESVI